MNDSKIREVVELFAKEAGQVYGDKLKKVILYGSEGGVKIFSSDYRYDSMDEQEIMTKNLPKAMFGRFKCLTF